MTALLPLVLVYQELAGVSGAAETPTLESLFIGPCYHIQDYPADRDSIETDAYGEEDADSGATGTSVAQPAAGAEALVLASAPNNITGAQLDHESVSVYLEEALVELLAGTAGEFGNVPPAENIFSVAGETFSASGVRPGDRLVVTTTAGDTFVHLIQEVGGYDGSTLDADEVRTTSNFTAAEDTDILWRIERPVGDATLPSAYVDFSDNVITILGGAELMVPVGGVDTALRINYARLFVEYRALRTDLAALQEVDENNLESVLGIVDERNPLAAGASVALANTTTTIQVFGVNADNLNGALDRHTAYAQAATQLESRDDIYMIVPLTSDQDVADTLHQHAIEFSEPEKAKFRAVAASVHALPQTKTLEGPSVSGTTEDVAQDDVSVLVLPAGQADLQSEGVRSGDTLYIASDVGNREGSAEVETVLSGRRVYAPELDALGVPADSDAQLYILRGAGTILSGPTGVDLIATDAITLESGATTDHVGHVLRLIDPDTNEDASPVGNNDYLITAVDVGTGVYTVVGPDLVAEAGLVATVVKTQYSLTTAVSVATRRAFRRILDNGASFISNGVVAGDVIQVPLPASVGGSDFSGGVYEATVEEILSENRVQLVPGSDVPTVTETDEQTGDLGYRVIRSLTKAGQRDELLSVVDSQTGYNSKRLVLVWPDEVLLSNVQNNKTGQRSRQPGFYAACVIGGMSAGLPPHRGFTFLGISGIEEIYHSSRYFSEDDLEALSNSGWYVFVQETSNSTPYSVHQLTTDTSDLRNMELSFVRNFDYVSRFYRRILERFIGRYNVTPQTLDILEESLNNGTDQLKSDSLPRIGAPLLGASIDSIAPLEGQKDRVEIFMSLDLPVPLNRIGLRLTA